MCCMCVCVYMCVCLYVHACVVYVCTQYVRVCTSISVCVCTYVHLSISPDLPSLFCH